MSLVLLSELLILRQLRLGCVAASYDWCVWQIPPSLHQVHEFEHGSFIQVSNRIYIQAIDTHTIKMQVCSEKAAAILSRFQTAKDVACRPTDGNHYCKFRGCERTKNKPFATRKAFLNHQRSVHSTKSQVCNCKKAFRYRNELKRHQKRIFAREKGCLG